MKKKTKVRQVVKCQLEHLGLDFKTTFIFDDSLYFKTTSKQEANHVNGIDRIFEGLPVTRAPVSVHS